MPSRVLLTAALAGLALPAVAGEIRGRALVEGKPAAGVVVRVLPFEEPSTSARREARREPAPPSLAETTTRADGTFAVVSPPAAAAGVVRVAFSGVPIASMLLDDVVEETGGDLGDVALPRAAVLAGRVVDGRGGPVVGATVTLLAGTGERGFRDDQLEPVPQADTTKADGGFRFAAASAEGNTLRVEAPAFASLERKGLRSGALPRPLVLELGQARRGLVTLADHRTPAAFALVRFEGRATTRWSEAGKDGTFVIDGLPREPGALVADAGDKGRAMLPVAAAATEAVTLVLAPTAAIAGRVVEADTAKPLAGVRVVARGDAGAPFLARSGPDGRYAIRGLSPRRYRMTVDDARFVRWTRSVSVPAGAAKAQDVALVRGATLSGRVVNEDGAPVAGAAIRVSQGTDRFRAFMRAMEADDRVRSGGDGSFRVTRLAPGENQRLEVSHEDYEEQAIGGIALPPGGTHSGVSVVLRRGLRLRGVTRDADGRPLAGVEVTLSRARTLASRRGEMQIALVGPGSEVRRETGGDGRFEFRGLKAGDYALSARKQGLGRASLDPVAVAEGKPDEPVELRLRPGESISGTLHDRAGNGAAGWYVAARPTGEVGSGPGPGPGAVLTEEATGPDGAFVLEGLGQGQSYDLQVMGRSGPGPRRTGVVAPSDGLDITVTGRGEIHGRVIDADSGRPLPDFDVRYEPDAQGGMRFVMRFGRGDGGPYQRRAVHAEDGSFVIEDVPAGRWTVQASAQGYQEGSAASVNVDEGGVADDVEVRLAKGGTISGRVMDTRSARPILDATVRAVPSGGGMGARGFRLGGEREGNEATTDSEGRYELTGLAPGRWELTASHPEWSDAVVSVDLKDAPASADIRLGQGGWIAGTVLAAGKPVAGADVALGVGGDGGFRGFGAEQWTLSDEAGRFRFERLTPGRYQVGATLRQQASASVDAVVTGEDGQEVSLVLLQGATIRGTVSGLPDAQLAGVSVSAQAPDYSASTRTAAGGTFELSGAPEGAVMLRATAGDFANGSRSASTNVTIATGQTDASAEIVFLAGFRIDGHVTRGGRPVPDAMVVASPGDSGRGRTATGRSDENGGYVLEGVTEGAYTFVASAQGSSPIRRSLTVDGDTTVDLEAPPARLSGVVVEAESGRPLGDVAVRLDDEQGGGGMRFLTMASTDSSGRFTFEDLDPRSYRVSFQKPAYQVETREIAASVDADTRVELRRGEGLALEVRDALFLTPLRGLMVRVLEAGGGSVFSGSVALDSDGRGEIPSLKPGSYELRAEASGYAPISLASVAVPSTMLALALSPGGSLEIHAGPETLALPDAAGRLIGSDGRAYMPDVFSSDGRIRLFAPLRRLDNVVPGRYSFEVAGGARRDVAIVEGGTASVTLP